MIEDRKRTKGDNGKENQEGVIKNNLPIKKRNWGDLEIEKTLIDAFVMRYDGITGNIQRSNDLFEKCKEHDLAKAMLTFIRRTKSMDKQKEAIAIIFSYLEENDDLNDLQEEVLRVKNELCGFCERMIGFMFCNLRFMLDTGKGKQYLAKAIERDTCASSSAFYELGFFYYRPPLECFLEKNIELSLQYFQKGAEKGDLRCNFIVGCIYESKTFSNFFFSFTLVASQKKEMG